MENKSPWPQIREKCVRETISTLPNHPLAIVLEYKIIFNLLIAISQYVCNTYNLFCTLFGTTSPLFIIAQINTFLVTVSHIERLAWCFTIINTVVPSACCSSTIGRAICQAVHRLHYHNFFHSSTFTTKQNQYTTHLHNSPKTFFSWTTMNKIQEKKLNMFTTF